MIERSPSSARIVLVGSNEFASDLALTLVSEGMGTFYSKQLEFMQNVIDLSLEDQGLLSIRGRTQFSRTLVSMVPGETGHVGIPQLWNRPRWPSWNLVLATMGQALELNSVSKVLGATLEHDEIGAIAGRIACAAARDLYLA